jgi:anti-sigma regulatory factor (Ser/Thr protein kinase)
MNVATHDLPCEASTPMRARRWAAGCLYALLGDAPGAGALIDDAVLCVSELVTNAVQAGCSAISLRLRIDQDVVRISIIDDASGHPTPRAAGPNDPTGRGLRLVEALTRRWGVDPAASGKEVWAEIARTG